MAKIETITELLIDEITHFEKEVKKLNELLKVLKTNKIDINTKHLESVHHKFMKEYKSETEALIVTKKIFIKEMKSQNKRMTFITGLLSIFIIVLISVLFKL